MAWEAQERLWWQALSKLNTWKRGDQRAVHKPLLTLMLIARAASDDNRRIYFAEIVNELTKLLQEFGPRRTSYHPEFPFWHLQTDGFWEVEKKPDLLRKKGNHSPTKYTLLKHDVVGAVPSKFWETLQHSPALREELARQLLDEFWPSTLHNAIRQAIGLPNADTQTVGIRQRIIRSPRFREEVLRAYERRCAICGYDRRLADTLLGLEAAHIKWHAYLGPDQVDNGIVLCSFHHVALDAGALGFSNDLHILVSCEVNGQTMVEELLHRFEGRKLRLPQSSYPPPAESYVKWHRNGVFHPPARTEWPPHPLIVLQKAAEGKELYIPEGTNEIVSE